MSRLSLSAAVAAAIATLLTFVALDALWLTTYAGPQFQRHLGPLLRSQPDLEAAALLYLICGGSLMYFAVYPAVAQRSLAVAVRNGAVLGLNGYAVFDLTCLAILRDYSWPLALSDLAWGTVLSAIAAGAGYAVAKRVARSPLS